MRTLNPKIIQISQCNQRTLQQTKDQKYDPASKINFMNFDLFQSHLFMLSSETVTFNIATSTIPPIQIESVE